MIFLQLLLAAFVVGYVWGNKKGKSASKDYSNEYDQYIMRLIEDEVAQTKNKPSINALQKLKNRIQGVTTNTSNNQTRKNSQQPLMTNTAVATQATAATQQILTSQPPIAQPNMQPITTKVYTPSEPVDKTSLLLYFGAFLFITSVGLFVAFGEVSGGLRTSMVAAVAIVLYGLGMYLHSSIKKLRQVGEAFVGIGMVMLPLVGVAAYSYIFDQSNGAGIWAMTSLIAILAYTYTVTRLQTTFVSYMLIGGVVSSLLSIVGIVDGPLYGFIWMLSITGLVMQIVSLLAKDIQPLREASSNSSILFTPLAVGLSILAIAESGTGQLAVTLALSCGYFAVQAIADKSRSTTYFSASHATGILSILVGVFSIQSSFVDLAYGLLAITTLHTIAILLDSKKRAPVQMQLTALAVAIMTPCAAVVDNELLSIGLVMAVVFGTLYTYRYKEVVGAILAGSSWLILSIVLGQVTIEPRLEIYEQILLSHTFVLLLIGLFLALRTKLNSEIASVLKTQTIIGITIASVFTLSSGDPFTIFVVFSSWYVVLLMIHTIDSDLLWATAANILVFAPFGYALLTHPAVDNKYFLSITTITSLVIAIGSALIYKSSWPRWASVGLWLILPYSIAFDGILSTSLSNYYVMIAYLLVAVVLAISRLIALGKLLPNAHIPLQSMMKHASIAYTAGFYSALSITTLTAMVANQSAPIQAFILAIAATMLVAYGYVVEKDRTFVAIIPLAAQAVLLRLLLPLNGGIEVLGIENSDYSVVLPLTSSVVAFMLFAYSIGNTRIAEVYRTTSMAMLFFGPSLVLFLGAMTWPMPYGFIAAAITLVLTNLKKPQSTIELYGSVVLFGIFWALYFHGVRNILVYTHFVAALIALYAYMRHAIGDLITEQSYTVAALSVLTIPVALAALGDTETYGLLMLFEQVGVFLIGLSLGKSYITRWGLYAAVATVIFQLRGLGWAMLAVLSLFIIGLAIYNSLKHNDT